MRRNNPSHERSCPESQAPDAEEDPPKAIAGTVSREELERCRLHDEATARSFDVKLNDAYGVTANDGELYWEFIAPPQYGDCRGPRTREFEEVSTLTANSVIDRVQTVERVYGKVGRLAEQNVAYERIDVVDVLERAYYVANLMVSLHEDPWDYPATELTVPVTTFDEEDESDDQRRVHVPRPSGTVMFHLGAGMHLRSIDSVLLHGYVYRILTMNRVYLVVCLAF